MQRTKVAAIVSVGVFVASLDLFIVNIAFPDIQRDFARHVARGAVVDPQRLRDRVRRAADPGRALGRPHGAQARVPARHERSSRWRRPLCAAAPSVGVLVAARVVQAAGAALLMPDVARAAAAGVPARAPPGRRSACGPRSAAPRRPPARCSAVCWSQVELALGVPRQRARSGSPRSSPARAILREIREPATERGRRPRRRAPDRRHRRAHAGDRQGPRLGLGQRPRDRRCSPPRRPARASSRHARRATRRRSSSPRSSGSARSVCGRRDAAVHRRVRRDAAVQRAAAHARAGTSRSCAPGCSSRPGPRRRR